MRTTAISTYRGGPILPCLPSVSHYIIPCSIGLQNYEHNFRKPIGLSGGFAKSKSCRLSARSNANARPEWDVEPNEAAQVGMKYYVDEQDVVTFLDPPKELIPLDPSSYNPASYLWKKIEDIPEGRRHHLLSLLNSRHISIAWNVAGRRYDDAKLAKKTSSSLLSGGKPAGSLEIWKCRTSGAPLPIAWINSSEKAIFCCTDGKAYGRLIGGYNLLKIVGSNPPLYFSVSQVNEVMATEEPCDLAYEFRDGLVDLPEYPQEFPKPDKHQWPFNDQVVIYIRHVGPGVMVGQAWQEGEALEQVPKKLCSEMLMVKDYLSFSKEN